MSRTHSLGDRLFSTRCDRRPSIQRTRPRGRTLFPSHMAPQIMDGARLRPATDQQLRGGQRRTARGRGGARTAGGRRSLAAPRPPPVGRGEGTRPRARRRRGRSSSSSATLLLRAGTRSRAAGPPRGPRRRSRACGAFRRKSEARPRCGDVGAERTVAVSPVANRLLDFLRRRRLRRTLEAETAAVAAARRTNAGAVRGRRPRTSSRLLAEGESVASRPRRRPRARTALHSPSRRRELRRRGIDDASAAASFLAAKATAAAKRARDGGDGLLEGTSMVMRAPAPGRGWTGFAQLCGALPRASRCTWRSRRSVTASARTITIVTTEARAGERTQRAQAHEAVAASSSCAAVRHAENTREAEINALRRQAEERVQGRWRRRCAQRRPHRHPSSAARRAAESARQSPLAACARADGGGGGGGGGTPRAFLGRRRRARKLAAQSRVAR